MYALKASRPGTGRRNEATSTGSGTPIGADATIERLLDMARRHLDMDVALLSRFDTHEQTIHDIAGDAEPFGLSTGQPQALNETYCQRRVDGRLTNIVADDAADPRVSGLRAAREGIGSNVGSRSTSRAASCTASCSA